MRSARALMLVTLIAATVGVSVLPSEARVPKCLGKRPTIVGTHRSDDFFGTQRDDVIVGLGGDDFVSGLGGDDVICGGSGHDWVSGQEGRDRLLGGRGRDVLMGGTGEDVARGGRGNDRVEVGGRYRDLAWGGPGRDSIEAYSGWSGPSLLMDLDEGMVKGLAIDRIGGFEEARACTWGVDVIILKGDAGPNSLIADCSNHTLIYGRGGADRLSGAQFPDLLSGGKGDDQLDGGGNDDRLDGGPGLDMASFQSNACCDPEQEWVEADLAIGVAHFHSPPTSRDAITRLREIEQVIGTFGHDVIFGNGQNNTFWGLEGDDFIDGREGEDAADGGPGADTCLAEVVEACES